MSSRILFYRCSGSSVGTDSRRLWVNSCSDLCALVEPQTVDCYKRRARALGRWLRSIRFAALTRAAKTSLQNDPRHTQAGRRPRAAERRGPPAPPRGLLASARIPTTTALVVARERPAV